MKKVLLIIGTLSLTSFLFFNKVKMVEETPHIATWYKTDAHKKVHREYSTAAYNHLPRYTKILVTNIRNNKSDTVVITDRMGLKEGCRIDLSKKSFGKLDNHSVGRISVRIKVIPSDTTNLNKK